MKKVQDVSNAAVDWVTEWWEAQPGKIRRLILIAAAIFFTLLIASLITFAVMQRSANNNPPQESTANEQNSGGEGESNELPDPEEDFENSPGERNDLPDEDQVEAAQEAAEEAILEWVDQDHKESKKDRQKRLEEVFTADSVVPTWDVPFPSEGGEEWIDADGQIESTDVGTQAPKRIVFTITVSVTRQVQYFDGETTHEENDEFAFDVAMLKSGDGWVADTLNQAGQ
jgi:hypothetical protein